MIHVSTKAGFFDSKPHRRSRLTFFTQAIRNIAAAQKSACMPRRFLRMGFSFQTQDDKPQVAE